MPESPNPVQAPAHILSLLSELHAKSLDQESKLAGKVYDTPAGFDDVMRDKFIALDEDKCHFVYSLLRATGARNVVEAGTSFGVSTIYLALAVGANVRSSPGLGAGTVIATENEPSKAQQAREYWKQAGPLVTDYIDLREGNLLETLKEGVSDVDLLLLDIWAPVALPTLKTVLPNFRKGAVVITDNTISAATRYTELLAFLRDPANGFINLTIPYSKGLEMSVFTGTIPN